MGMAEMIDKWEVVNKLIQLENNYNFYKDVWDAQTLYRRIFELEIGIGKTPGVEVVPCAECTKSGCCIIEERLVTARAKDRYCCLGERREE